MTLVILAAGLGSRYGGLKQIDPVGECGEFIIDYSIYDAKRAGFDKVVFIILEQNCEAFEETIGKRIAPFMKVEYAFQTMDTEKYGYKAPDGRTKPFGTAQALICAKDKIHENFAVINADDFYGRGAYELMAGLLENLSGNDACMIGYRLENTLSENGSVSRGICELSGNKVKKITEHTKIYKGENGIFCACSDDIHSLSPDDFASMNFFGFTPSILSSFEDGFREFLKEKGSEMKSEYYLPFAASAYASSMTLVPTNEKWFGVTYHEDKAAAVGKIREMTQKGIYPIGLWK